MKENYVGFDRVKQTFNHDWAWWDGVRHAPRKFELHQVGDEYDGTDEFEEEGMHLDKESSFNLTSIHIESKLKRGFVIIYHLLLLLPLPLPFNLF